MRRSAEPAAGIARLTALGHDAAEARVAVLVAQEARIRQALSALEHDARIALIEAHSLERLSSQGHAEAWRRWLMDRRRQLLIELAAVLARKDDAAHALAFAAGRNAVAQGMAEDRRIAERQVQSRKGFGGLAALAMMAAQRDRPR